MGRDLPTRRSGVQHRRATQRTRREALSEGHAGVVDQGRGGFGALIGVAARVIAAAAAGFVLYILIQGGPASEPTEAGLGDPAVETEADLAESELAVVERVAAPDAAAPRAAAVEDEPANPEDAALRADDPLGLMNALARAFPEAHQTLAAELDALTASGATPTAVARRRSAYIAALLTEKLAFAPYAGAGAHAAYFDSNLRLLDAVRERLDAEACARVVVAGGAALGPKLQGADEATRGALFEVLADQTAMMLDVARIGSDTGARDLPTPTGADWRALYRGMESRGASASQVAMFRDGALTGAEPLCDVTRIYYQALLSLEADAAARLHPTIIRNTLSPPG